MNPPPPNSGAARVLPFPASEPAPAPSFVDSLSDDEFDALFPRDDVRRSVSRAAPARSGPHIARLDAEEDAADHAADSLPDATELAEEQHTDAVFRVHKGPLRTIQWRLPDVQSVAGPVKPGDLVITSARTGSGKTLFYQNTFDDMVEAGHVGLYIGTEQDPDVLKIKWACTRAGIHPRLILAPEKHEINTADHVAAKDRLQAELKVISSPDYARRAIFANDARRLSTAELRRWLRGAKRKYDIGFVVIDHVDRLNAGDGRNMAHEMNEVIVAAKELAVELDVIVFLASQVRRAPDQVIALTAPTLEDCAGSSGKEREADLMLTVYRPLDPHAAPSDLKLVRQRLLDPSAVWLRNVMAVKCLKHRLDDSRWGKVALLDVQGHRLHHRDGRHNHATTALSR